jgi:hypothetical protein
LLRGVGTLVKAAGGKLYFYYGLLPLLQSDRRYKNALSLYNTAVRLLSATRLELFGNDLEGSLVPFNIVSVDGRRSSVSFMWYRGFWEEKKPLLVYSIKVDTRNGDVNVYVNRRSEAGGSWPWNYLHRKEMFIDGLERIVLDPYGNGVSLAWNAKSRRDEWVKLGWRPLSVKVRASSEEDRARLAALLEEVFGEVARQRIRAKVLIEVVP